MDSREKAVTQGILEDYASSIRDSRRKPGKKYLFRIGFTNPTGYVQNWKTTIVCIGQLFIYMDEWKGLLYCYNLIDLQEFHLIVVPCKYQWLHQIAFLIKKIQTEVFFPLKYELYKSYYMSHKSHYMILRNNT